MHANDVHDAASGQREMSRFRLGAVGIAGVVSGLSVPLTLGFGLLIAAVLTVVLAVQRRWGEVGVVIGAAAVGIAAWTLFATVVNTGPGNGGFSPPDRQ